MLEVLTVDAGSTIVATSIEAVSEEVLWALEAKILALSLRGLMPWASKSLSENH